MNNLQTDLFSLSELLTFSQRLIGLKCGCCTLFNPGVFYLQMCIHIKFLFTVHLNLQTVTAY